MNKFKRNLHICSVLILALGASATAGYSADPAPKDGNTVVIITDSPTSTRGFTQPRPRETLSIQETSKTAELFLCDVIGPCIAPAFVTTSKALRVELERPVLSTASTLPAKFSLPDT